MPAFVVSYVPQVEEVDLIKKLNQVDNVSNVDTVQQVRYVDTVDKVNTVYDVRKLPHPYFPLKKFNFQQGGMVHITPTQNLYQAVYIPQYDCEFKGVHLSFTSYNIEDTYDVMIGSRYVIKDSHVKEMAEYRMFEVYEVVGAGTPIVIQFHNNSGLEKYMMYEIITLIDSLNMTYTDILSWNFYWSGEQYTLNEQDTFSLLVNQPNYVNLDSIIDSFELEVIDLIQNVKIATIYYTNGILYSDYAELNTVYQNLGLLARVSVIGIVQVRRFDKMIEIVFKNLSNTGTMNNHPIEIGIKGFVNNKIKNL